MIYMQLVIKITAELLSCRVIFTLVTLLKLSCYGLMNFGSNPPTQALPWMTMLKDSIIMQ